MREVLLLPLLAVSTFGQPLHPTFEVAAVRRDNAGQQAPNGFFPSPGRLRVTNMSLEQLIHAAYHLPTGTVIGLSEWMEANRYDIDATQTTRASFEEELTMLQSLLEERFELRYHYEIRRLKTVSLVIGRSGAKINRAESPDAREQVRIGTTEIVGTGVPFGHFVSILQEQLGYPITNQTGLTGAFDISLRYTRDDAGGPSLSAAVEEQLGLKMESHTGPVRVFVIDSARAPSGN